MDLKKYKQIEEREDFQARIYYGAELTPRQRRQQIAAHKEAKLLLEFMLSDFKNKYLDNK